METLNYRKVVIKSSKDFPKEGIRVTFHMKGFPIDETSCLKVYSKDVKWWLREVDWYFKPVPEPSDEDIEKWAKGNFLNTEELIKRQEAGNMPIITAIIIGRIEGAKAALNGEIKTSKI